MNENITVAACIENLKAACHRAGQAAHARGGSSAAALDAELEGVPSLVSTCLREWQNGWHLANVTAPVPSWTAAENAAYVAAVSLPAGPCEPALPSPRVTDAELSAFAQAIQNNLVTYYTTHYKNLGTPTVTIDKGSKNARIVVNGPGTSRSSYCFVELATGNILKCAGWKTPARGVRGNIRSGDASNWWNGALTSTGAAYLR